MSADSSFRQYFRNPTDDNIRRLYLESNWDWLLSSSGKDLASALGKRDLCDVPLKSLSLESVRSRVEEDGYYSSANNDVGFLPVDMSLKTHVIKLRTAVELLVSHGYPPTFVLLLDECWDTVESMSELMNAGTGNSVCNMDILAWLVDPKEGSGFSPHRDRQPLDVASSFRADGTPKYATCWLALSAAHTDNSCLYMIPKYLDPGYLISDNIPEEKSGLSKKKKISKQVINNDTIETVNDGYSDRDPLREALLDKEDYQHIRAIPLNAGEFVIFTHRILHWGSKGRKNYKGPPRISFSVAFSDPAFEAPYFSVQTGRPSFEMRLALSCAQMIVYYQRYNFEEGALLLFKKCFDLHAHSFHEEYRLKVMQEYCVAVMEIETLKESNTTTGYICKTNQSSSSGSKSGNSLKDRSESQLHNENNGGSSKTDKCNDKDDHDDNDDDDDDDDDDEDEEGSEGDEENASESSESDEDEDGGFAFPTEGAEEDPMEHALDTLLDIELEINRNTKKPRKK